MKGSVSFGRARQQVLNAGPAVTDILHASGNAASFALIGEQAKQRIAMQGMHRVEGVHVIADEFLYLDNGHCKSRWAFVVIEHNCPQILGGS